MKRDVRPKRFIRSNRGWVEDDDEEMWDEPDGMPEHLEVDGPSYAPMFTGVLDANGDPILRHPIIMRMGFHPENRKYYCPTLDDTGYDEDPGRIFGWAYDN